MGKTLILLLILVSCSHRDRSKYTSYKHQEGFQEKSEDGFSFVSFLGNAETKLREAYVFARFRSIELCGEKLSYEMNVRDRSEKKELIRSSGAAYPYYGMGFGGRYSSMGIGFGNMPMNAWSETQVYPEMDVVYVCVDRTRGPELGLKEISKEDMKLLVKDLKGGLQVEHVDEKSVNHKNVEVGDIILKFNGQRVEKLEEVLQFFVKAPRAEVDLLREGVKKKTTIVSRDITPLLQEDQTLIIKEACKFKEIAQKKQCRN